jgi:hypothetical protein
MVRRLKNAPNLGIIKVKTVEKTKQIKINSEEFTKQYIEKEKSKQLIEQEKTKVSLEQEKTKVSLEQEKTKVSLEEEKTKVLIEQEKTKVLLEQEKTKVLLEQEKTKQALLNFRIANISKSDDNFLITNNQELIEAMSGIKNFTI